MRGPGPEKIRFVCEVRTVDGVRVQGEEMSEVSGQLRFTVATGAGKEEDKWLLGWHGEVSGRRRVST